jgi:DNA-binding protein HU-beta
MTKAELIEQMAKDAGISKVAAAAALDSFMGCVIKELKKRNGKLTLVGFGTFKKVYRKTRKGRNPQTGEIIKIKGKNVVKFTQSEGLSEKLSGGPGPGG